MPVKCSVIYLVVFLIHLLVEVKGQICERQEIVTVVVPITYQTSYREYYGGTCYRCRTKTRWVTHKLQRNDARREIKTIKFCCTGYMRVDDESNDSDIACDPICTPACKNGFCKSPGECACFVGYSPDLSNTHNCLPVCEKVCAHGVCVAPNSCQCDFGYTLVNGTCQPVCTEPCRNGTCTAPETCECLPGFRKTENNLCEPYCSNGCDNGFCSAPETCSCNPGWNLTDSKELSRKLCKPFCSEPCDNGDCVAPDTCKCWPGWKSDNSTCVAECENDCGNGTCIAPNDCDCLDGFHFDNTTCVPTCVECSETCVAPYECVNTEEILPRKESICLNCTTDEDVEELDISELGPMDVPAPSNRTVFETDTHYDDYDENDRKTYEDFEPLPDFESNKASDKDSFNNNAQPGVTKAETITDPWIQQHWVSVFIPVLMIIVTAGIVMFIVWRWTHIIVYFKGRSYVVQDGDGAENFEDIQIAPRYPKEIKQAQL